MPVDEVRFVKGRVEDEVEGLSGNIRRKKWGKSGRKSSRASCCEVSSCEDGGGLQLKPSRPRHAGHLPRTLRQELILIVTLLLSKF